MLEKAWWDNEHPSSVHGCEYIVLTRFKLGSRRVEPSYQVDFMLKILPAVARGSDARSWSERRGLSAVL